MTGQLSNVAGFLFALLKGYTLMAYSAVEGHLGGNHVGSLEK